MLKKLKTPEAIIGAALIVVMLVFAAITFAPVSYDVEDCIVKVHSGSGHGTGVIIHESGIIVTAGHVLEGVGVNEARVTLRDGTELEVIPHLCYASLDRDVAFIKVKTAQPLPTVKIGKIGNLEIGDDLMIVGYPLWESDWHSYGRVSKLPGHGWVNVSIFAAPGYSGGPIVDEDGRLVGIVIRGALGTGITQGTGIDLIMAVYEKYLIIYDTEKIQRYVES